MNFKKFIGDKKFYKTVLMVAVPIMIQNGITNFVGMLNNIMVGRIGTAEMSGVAIVNQLLFVFNVCIFGAISGASIFGAQFYGSGNHEGFRNAFRVKYYLCGFMCLIAFILFYFYGENLISLYLHDSSDSVGKAEALAYGMKYLHFILPSLFFFAVDQIYSSTLRETGKTLVPMISGITAVLVNLLLNYILIYGKLGVPAYGVAGAAIATVISRFIELMITMVWTHKNKEKNPFIVGVYKTFKIPASLVKQILIKGSPLIINEALWASGMAILTQCYSFRGLNVIAALNISSTIANVFNIVYLAMGSSIAIIIGQLLGAGKMEEAQDTDRKLIFFSVASCAVFGFFLVTLSKAFPMIYNTTESIKDLASGFILVTAICMPLNAFTHASYFTLRSGGKTIITFLFDSVFVWTVSIPLAYILSRFTSLPILPLYLFCQLADIIKCIIGYILVHKGIWLHNMVSTNEVA